MQHAHGSARLRIGNITDVLVSVKLEIDTPFAERPNEGKLDFFVDWYDWIEFRLFMNLEYHIFILSSTANATPAFEGKGGDDLGTEISNVLSRSYQSSNVIDLRQLCIIPNMKCWKIYVDVLVSISVSISDNRKFCLNYSFSCQILQCGGNLFDTVGAAVKAALYNTEIPKVTLAVLDGGKPEIQVSDDPYDCIKLDVTNYPMIVTICKVCNNYDS